MPSLLLPKSVGAGTRENRAGFGHQDHSVFVPPAVKVKTIFHRKTIVKSVETGVS